MTWMPKAVIYKETRNGMIEAKIGELTAFGSSKQEAFNKLIELEKTINNIEWIDVCTQCHKSEGGSK